MLHILFSMLHLVLFSCSDVPSYRISLVLGYEMFVFSFKFVGKLITNNDMKIRRFFVALMMCIPFAA